MSTKRFSLASATRVALSCLITLALMIPAQSPPAPVKAASGFSAICHVTDGIFTVCPDGNEEWSDVSVQSFPESQSFLYGDQADLDPILATPDSPLDTFMLMYDECGRTVPLGPDEYFLVSFDTVEVVDGVEKLEHYVVHIFTDGTIIFIEDGVVVPNDEGQTRAAEIEGQRGDVGFGSSPNCAFDHVTAEFQIELSEAGGHSYSPDPLFWGGLTPNRPPVANDDSAEIGEETSVTISVLANDTDLDGTLVPATVTITSLPRYGTAMVNSDGTATYTRGPDFKSADRFSYTVRDNDDAVSNIAIVEIFRRCSNQVGASLDGKSSPWAAGELTKPGTDVDKDGLKHEVESELDTDPCHYDTDGDGLIDSWEVKGVEGAGFDIDGNGTIDATMDQVFNPLDSPDPLHKDVFTEIDFYNCAMGGCPSVGPFHDPMVHHPDITGIQDVITMFSQLGVKLHVQQDEAIKHDPHCDQPPIKVRSTFFGTEQQRRDANVLTAKELAFRYVLAGHSTLKDDSGPCDTPSAWKIIKISHGKESLPDYDNSPFGQTQVGGKDIIVSLGPLWICPQTINECDRDGLLDVLGGIFPASVLDAGVIKNVVKPYARLLGRPDPLNPNLGEQRGITQLWGRTLAHLLGHSLGIVDHSQVDNSPTRSDPLPAGLNYWPPEPYGGLSALKYASSLYTLDASGERLRFTPLTFGSPTAPEATVFGNPIEELLQTDRDGDGVIEHDDNCSGFSNPGQEDLDSDGFGNACDTDIDGDGIANELDAFPNDTDNDGIENVSDDDDDRDGVVDASDNCSLVSNADQQDRDGDGIGDVCDTDADNDTFPDLLEAIVGSGSLDPASTPEFVEADNSCGDGLDNDLDGAVDEADEGCIDIDQDSLPDYLDRCPLVADVGWVDQDGDGLGDACDVDDDNDGFSDSQETELGSDLLNRDSTPEYSTLPATCTDGVDNDLDNLIDAEDSGCIPIGLVNGNFETGTLDGWDVSPGSIARAITSLGPAGPFTPILPPESQFMAFLSTAGTAPTPPGTLGSVISQTFVMPADSSTLDFCYQFISNDSAEFENFFLAELETGLGTFTLATADNAAGSPAGGTQPPPPPEISPGVTLSPNPAPIFLSEVNILGSGLFIIPSSLMTERVCSSFEVPPGVRGTAVTLRFTVGDVLDTNFDSAVIIDALPKPTDSDGDKVADALDNCPQIANPDQQDSNLNGIGDACETPDLQHSTAAFLQAVSDGSTTAEPRSLLVSEEPDVLERLVKIVDFRVNEGLTDSAANLTANLVNSLVDLGLVPPEQAAALVTDVLEQVVLNVSIDIKPGSFPNSIKLKSTGTLPVAILSTPNFDAPSQVNKTSPTFGRTGDEKSLAFCNNTAQDVNGDGLLDQVCHFYAQLTGFKAGDTVGILKGKTTDSISIMGTDSVRIIR